MNFEKMFTTIDTHVAGEAFRVVMHSSISLLNESLESAALELQGNYENEKNLLLNEPRGHRGMHGCMIMPSKIADYRLLFFNHSDVNDFKYEGLITTITALLETGNIKKNEDDVYKIETINGVYSVKVTIENQEVRAVCIENKLSVLNEQHPDYSSVTIDDGRTYFIYPLPNTIPGIQLENLANLSRWGLEQTMKLKEENIEFDGVVLTESAATVPSEVRSITFEKDGYILRSPGIDSTYAIFASLLGSSAKVEALTNTSVFGSKLTANLVSAPANQFSVEAEAFVTGMNQFIFDQDDPLKDGFLLA